jgi:hypothetical protein
MCSYSCWCIFSCSDGGLWSENAISKVHKNKEEMKLRGNNQFLVYVRLFFDFLIQTEIPKEKQTKCRAHYVLRSEEFGLEANRKQA